MSLTRAILEQLRRDLATMARGRAVELDRLLGRAPQYFRRVESQNLLLQDALTAMRFLGFRPAEYFQLFMDRESWIPAGAPKFFSRYPLPNNKKLRLTSLSKLSNWVRGVQIGDVESPLWLDLQERLATLCSSPEEEDVLSYGNEVFTRLVNSGPATLSPQVITDLIGSLLYICRHLPEDLHQQRTAAHLIALGFDLEAKAGQLSLRRRLYLAGARTCGHLGFPIDGLWCARQALMLSALLPKASELMTETHEIRSSILAATKGDSGRRSRLLRPIDWRPDSDLSELGRQDLQHLLAALESSRATQILSATQLDRALGGKRAYSHGVRRRSFKLERWEKLSRLLEVSPRRCIEVAASLDSEPPPLEMAIQPLQSLKILRQQRREHCIQESLAPWVDRLQLGQADSLAIPREAMQQAETMEGFEKTMAFCRGLVVNLPVLVRSDDVKMISEGLLRSSHSLRKVGCLGDSGDFLALSFSLQKRLENRQIFAFSCRLAAYLMIDLGHLRFADVYLTRAEDEDLQQSNPAGLAFTSYISAFVAMLRGKFARAHQKSEVCSNIVEAGNSTLGIWPVRVLNANIFLRQGNLASGRAALEQAEYEFEERSTADRFEFLTTKAELLSREGGFTEPLSLYGRAERLLQDGELSVRDTALLGLARCRHLVRFNQLAEATEVARALLPLAAKLKTNPVGSLAIQEIARRAFYSSTQETEVRIASHRVQFPNLPAQGC